MAIAGYSGRLRHPVEHRAWWWANVVGGVALVVGLAVCVATVVIVVAVVERDDDGFVVAEVPTVDRDVPAVSTGSLDLGRHVPWVLTSGWFGDTTVRVTARSPRGEVFMGIGPSDDVSRYLENVGHDVVSDLSTDPLEVTYERRDGGPPTTPPGVESFWVARSDTGESPSLSWDLEAGDWSAVLMNADGSSPLRADLRVGARVPTATAAALALIGAVDDRPPRGVLLVIVGAALLWWGRRRRPDPTRPTDDTGAESSPGGAEQGGDAQSPDDL